ncbi:hypothetical protein PtB15_7B590 [Puccinia triticina]|nr:hypothetical protein PtB15_7B590 [Puccinia triticina]
MSEMGLYSFAAPRAIAARLQAGRLNEDWAVVDVRGTETETHCCCCCAVADADSSAFSVWGGGADSDYIGGHIPGCRHEPSETFEARCGALVAALKDVRCVVFHCMLSQQRGPTAASLYAHRRDAALASGALTSALPFGAEARRRGAAQEVLVVAGGFRQWAAEYGGDPALLSLDKTRARAGTVALPPSSASSYFGRGVFATNFVPRSTRMNEELRSIRSDDSALAESEDPDEAGHVRTLDYLGLDADSPVSPTVPHHPQSAFVGGSDDNPYSGANSPSLLDDDYAAPLGSANSLASQYASTRQQQLEAIQAEVHDKQMSAYSALLNSTSSNGLLAPISRPRANTLGGASLLAGMGHSGFLSALNSPSQHDSLSSHNINGINYNWMAGSRPITPDFNIAGIIQQPSRSLWIGNFDPSTTAQELMNVFARSVGCVPGSPRFCIPSLAAIRFRFVPLPSRCFFCRARGRVLSAPGSALHTPLSTPAYSLYRRPPSDLPSLYSLVQSREVLPPSPCFAMHISPKNVPRLRRTRPRPALCRRPRATGGPATAAAPAAFPLPFASEWA